MLGYRPGDVHKAIAELELELGKRSEELRSKSHEADFLRAEREALGGGLERSEHNADGLRAQLDDVTQRADDQLRCLAIVGRQLDELRISARGGATRIRLGALREAAELSARIDDFEALGADGDDLSERDRLLDAVEDAIERVAGEWDAAEPTPPSALSARRAAAIVATNRSAPATRRTAVARRRVSVDVGPFEDFSQLVRFEDAANAIGATGDISIKRFSEGRARIDLALSEPVDLLRELEERCDFEFRVRSTAEDEIVLDVD